ncbi:MAG: LPS export ABC transporter ATP-binding protein [Omnitrophica bacterium RIFCSPLOWO2_12_FULL_44_17]|uniref:LPS export ABC transporter ATP-binding protein n=1 Tax=Candidatus Danuiimicrobium aquiferis TaxID=1801832 RepID=A0A1G1L1Z0_9BACT|nr:MAG: LPS export ABC transporter ATP-binding protein [Omnitrophica bacterium RIFCSPHIGHO2_02_FULL_45_28]OGW91286.1 MAG: LPS export ABC transporter ATP-binding protein [Omnitrophica bacterium RIFCSPHIGHO2_12_FULL_44_12]OGW99183.1 MAG: LPS export ABC transporter ATP-binding protein [Omnitrophica bacterium RIFCSPLOWO2_12_FULL_44_17]OGX04401.1 MAG: LPS export ABC transporter ATP-binding protein [Omnitrophica bacterium RIFCSPLOWO2_02_FULL_44_11]
MYLLETQALTKSYKGRTVANQVSVNISRGEIVGLLGPNGAGKTTTFYMIVGVIRSESGKILFRGEDITNLPMYKRARLGVGYLSQEPSIFRKLTVEENIMAILETLDIPQVERDKRLKRLLEELDIAHLAKNKAYTLSGGERRRLEITRALVTNPSLILLDEPFSGVDPIAVFEVQKILKRLKTQGLSILLTDHSVRETLSITDRAYIMCEGKIEVSGTSQFLSSDKRAREIYLGERFVLV